MTITVRLDDEARRGWARLAQQHDLNFTVLIEAIGRLLDEHPGRMPTAEEAIKLATAIKEERGSRKLGDT